MQFARPLHRFVSLQGRSFAVREPYLREVSTKTPAQVAQARFEAQKRLIYLCTVGLAVGFWVAHERIYDYVRERLPEGVQWAYPFGAPKGRETDLSELELSKYQREREAKKAERKKKQEEAKSRAKAEKPE
ncbi:MAG: hypothetical protein MHM6MM_008136 [Cercozoa sp. M6MM]